jgi:transposase
MLKATRLQVFNHIMAVEAFNHIMAVCATLWLKSHKGALGWFDASGHLYCREQAQEQLDEASRQLQGESWRKAKRMLKDAGTLSHLDRLHEQLNLAVPEPMMREARVFRRAQAVRDVVKGQRLQTVSDTLSFTYSALRKWVHRFAHQGTPGLVDRPRPGRPPTVTCALEQHLNRLVDQDPLEHGALHSQWSCRELATVLARETGVHLGRESVRGVLKKRM